MRRLFTAGLLLTLLAGGMGLTWLRRAANAPGPLPTPSDLVIPREGVAPLSRDLAALHLVKDPLVFRMAALLSHGDGNLHAAEFSFPAQASVAQVLQILRTAKPVLHKLTIPEGLTAQQIAILLTNANAASGPVPPLTEGELFPDTYKFERGVSRAALVRMAKAQMDKVLQEEWQDRVAGLPLATPEQALILASIVEHETALPDERPHVAAVFENRLRAGMKLESDPTVIYGASNGLGELDHPITRAELDAATPYNTYVITGLPPTPIASPGRAAIHAVLHPLASEDLYFVANGTGGSSFAPTLSEHKQNVEKWRKLGH